MIAAVSLAAMLLAIAIIMLMGTYYLVEGVIDDAICGDWFSTTLALICLSWMGFGWFCFIRVLMKVYG